MRGLKFPKSAKNKRTFSPSPSAVVLISTIQSVGATRIGFIGGERSQLTFGILQHFQNRPSTEELQFSALVLLQNSTTQKYTQASSW